MELDRREGESYSSYHKRIIYGKLVDKTLSDYDYSELAQRIYGKEYASDVDRLANFRQPTAMMNMSPAEVCLMYQMKHISSVAKIAKETSQGIIPSKELLQEKCQDMLNYTLIFYAIVNEMIESNQEKK